MDKVSKQRRNPTPDAVHGHRSFMVGSRRKAAIVGPRCLSYIAGMQTRGLRIGQSRGGRRGSLRHRTTLRLRSRKRRQGDVSQRLISVE